MPAQRIADAPLELWGGIECTVNRVGDDFRDQLAENGHALRLDDLDRIARLGIRALRYPLLWERAQPALNAPMDWTWAEERLPRLRELGIRPIAGLVHHGSGPRGTQLTDPSFAIGLTTYARQLAERFPWLEDFTPVNEPLTTARFSGLYGHWYPHGRSPRIFIQALLHQCRATAEAMQAIRAINPAARLIQTDDLGQISSTPGVSYQADFENERRWLTWDLLCGRVVREHPLYDYLRWLEIDERELEWFAENPCPPDIIGINHYVTSDRFLDERVELYPPERRGGNGRHAYVDVEAVRAGYDPGIDVARLLRAAADRYGLPLAITECHLGCTREQQMRWLLEIWNTATEQRAAGIDVRAVTVWALFGSFDWNTLVTQRNGYYEPGPFDLRAPQPRCTALAGMMRTLSRGDNVAHPVLQTRGWWHGADKKAVTDSAAPLLIVGAGTLGRAFSRICAERGLAHRLLSRRDLDIAEVSSIESALQLYEPWAIINAAGYVRVDPAENEPQLCLRENTLGPAHLALACAGAGIPLLTFSSDLVFDGQQDHPYCESDRVAPLNVYGRSKAEAEQRVLQALPEALVVRTSSFFGPWDQANFVHAVLRSLMANEPHQAADDLVMSPTYVPDLVHTCLDLLIDGERGIWHLSNAGQVTWAEFARCVAEIAGLNADTIIAVPARKLGLVAPRPAYSVLGSERGPLLGSLAEALQRFFRDQQAFAAAC